jgi:hypothetical protein
MTPIDHQYRGQGKIAALLVVYLFFGSIAVLWAWNTMAVDLFALPEMQFKHGFSFMLATFFVLSAAPITKRIFGQKQKD